MAQAAYEHEILEHIRRLKPEDQRRVLEFARSLSRPAGTPGKLFMQITDDISIDSDDLKIIEQSIEEAFEDHGNTEL